MVMTNLATGIDVETIVTFRFGSDQLMEYYYDASRAYDCCYAGPAL